MAQKAKNLNRSDGERPKALVVDDHPLVRRSLVDLLEGELDLEVCGEAEDSPTAMKLAREHEPDMMIIDISLKEGSGLQLVQQVHAELPETRMLVSSMHDEHIYAERCLAAGALGYVSKQADTEDLIEGIKRVLASKVYLSEEMSSRILQRAAGGQANLESDPVDNLSDRELEVFRLMGQGLGSREIAEQLHLSTKTIDTYREHIKAKLDLKSAKEVIRYAVTWCLDHERLRESRD